MQSTAASGWWPLRGHRLVRLRARRDFGGRRGTSTIANHCRGATMRIGAVSYLNTKPLVYRLAELAPQHELVFDLPSRLADDLAAGRLDVALIPSVEFFKNPTYTIVSDACIACRGPVRSVKLFSRVPLSDVRTLALDEWSRTSATLVRILLRERFGIEPKFLPDRKSVV